jgi:hypothetical protein
MFKPRDPFTNDFEGWHRTPIEYVAYELSLLLGLDLVPPVAYRHNTHIDMQDGHHFSEGVFIYYAPSAAPLHHTPEDQWGVSKDLLLSDTRILDTLLQNSDRHLGHFLWGEHWCRGKWKEGRWHGDFTPVLIDHAAGFRHGAVVNMDHDNAFMTGPVKCASSRTYLRLKFLDRQGLQKLKPAVSDDEISQLLARRDGILQYLDHLVHEQGLDRTIRGV